MFLLLSLRAAPLLLDNKCSKVGNSFLAISHCFEQGSFCPVLHPGRSALLEKGRKSWSERDCHRWVEAESLPLARFAAGRCGVAPPPLLFSKREEVGGHPHARQSWRRLHSRLYFSAGSEDA